METIAISVQEAEKFLATHQRHYKMPVEAICAIGIGELEPFSGAAGVEPCGAQLKLHGAAILGRRADGDAELANIYVDGSFQGYSILYGACWRALKALGYKRAWL